MAVVTATSLAGSGVRVMVETTLAGGAGDDITYQKGDILILRNPTGGVINATFDGDGGTTWPVDGVGDVAVSAGLATTNIAAGAARVIAMDSIRAYLQGTVKILSGAGLVASLLRNP